MRTKEIRHYMGEGYGHAQEAKGLTDDFSAAANDGVAKFDAWLAEYTRSVQEKAWEQGKKDEQTNARRRWGDDGLFWIDYVTNPYAKD
jgi:hypothetical protein